jgi:hypothetical protein
MSRVLGWVDGFLAFFVYLLMLMMLVYFILSFRTVCSNTWNVGYGSLIKLMNSSSVLGCRV